MNTEKKERQEFIKQILTDIAKIKQHVVEIISLQSLIKCDELCTNMGKNIVNLDEYTSSTPMNIIQIYALTTDYTEDDVDSFYGQLNETITSLREHLLIIIGVFLMNKN